MSEQKKKYDLAIMNPPYDRNLHLKILEKVIPVAEETINISPDGWISDYAALMGYKKSPNKKFIDSLGPKIVDYKILSASDFNDVFGIANWGSGMISKFKQDANSDLYKKISEKTHKQKSFIEKVIKPMYEGKFKSFKQMYGVNKDKYNYFIKLSRVHGHIGSYDQYDLTSRELKYSLNVHDKEGKEIYFETKREAINFFDTLHLTFYKYIKYLGVYSYADFNAGMPFMSDYIKPWDNKRFCDYFNITGYISDTEAEPDSEWEEILNTMEKYK